MSLFNSKASKNTLVYIILAMVILIIILIFGGADWLRGSHLNRSIGISHWNWVQILISIGIGLAIGWIVLKKRT